MERQTREKFTFCLNQRIRNGRMYIFLFVTIKYFRIVLLSSSSSSTTAIAMEQSTLMHVIIYTLTLYMHCTHTHAVPFTCKYYFDVSPPHYRTTSSPMYDLRRVCKKFSIYFPLSTRCLHIVIYAFAWYIFDSRYFLVRPASTSTKNAVGDVTKGINCTK